MFETIMIFLWLLSGWLSMVFWWIKAYDLTTNDLFIIFVSGFIGPASFILGWLLFGKVNGNNIIIQKRRK